jgi:hypothetical protein
MKKWLGFTVVLVLIGTGFWGYQNGAKFFRVYPQLTQEHIGTQVDLHRGAERGALRGFGAVQEVS